MGQHGTMNVGMTRHLAVATSASGHVQPMDGPIITAPIMLTLMFVKYNYNLCCVARISCLPKYKHRELTFSLFIFRFRCTVYRLCAHGTLIQYEDFFHQNIKGR
jgi:hypothetical protein